MHCTIPWPNWDWFIIYYRLVMHGNSNIKFFSSILIHRHRSPKWSNPFISSDQLTLLDVITVITFGDKQNCKIPSLYVFLPFSFYSFALKSKYSPQLCLLNRPQSVSLSGSEEQSFTPISYIYELQLPNPKSLTLLESQYFSPLGPHPAADIHTTER